MGLAIRPLSWHYVVLSVTLSEMPPKDTFSLTPDSRHTYESSLKNLLFSRR
jgi:hypothetical protein